MRKKESKVCCVSLISTMEQKNIAVCLFFNWAVYKLSKVLGCAVKNVEVYLLDGCHVYKVEFFTMLFRITKMEFVAFSSFIYSSYRSIATPLPPNYKRFLSFEDHCFCYVSRYMLC